MPKVVDLMVCLPPKSGTTNYQRAFAMVQLNKTIENIPKPPKLYSVMKRVKPRFFTAEPLNLNVEHSMANVRNPFDAVF